MAIVFQKINKKINTPNLDESRIFSWEEFSRSLAPEKEENLMKGEIMKKVIIGSAIAVALFAFSGCTYKSACAPKLPTCASACVTTPCGCPK